jgi:hypothetical protein
LDRYGVPRRDAAKMTGSWPEGRYSRASPASTNFPPRPSVSWAHHVEEVQAHPADQHRLLGRNHAPVDVGRHGRREVAQAELGGGSLQFALFRAEPGREVAQREHHRIDGKGPAAVRFAPVQFAPVQFDLEPSVRLPAGSGSRRLVHLDGDAVGQRASSSSTVDRR